MALSFVSRIPMLRSTVENLNSKYNQVKSGNIVVYIILSFVELCFFVIAQLFTLVQNFDFKKHLDWVSNYVYVFVCHYATPILWVQMSELFVRSVRLIMEASSAVVGYVEKSLGRLRSAESSHTTVNFDSTTMTTFIDLITKSLSELRTKQTSLDYEDEFRSGTKGKHSAHGSTSSCLCESNLQLSQEVYSHNLEPVYSHNLEPVYSHNLEPVYSHNPEPVYSHNFEPVQNNDHLETFHREEQEDDSMTSSSNPADDNIIAVPSRAGFNQENEGEFERTQDEGYPEESKSKEEWHRLFPSTQPLIPMMSADRAFELAKALQLKRQDKTGRDAYEVDTVLALLSQWHVIDDRTRHYAIDRANLLYLAICYGWNYALQKVTPNTTTPIVTQSPPLTQPLPVKRQSSNEGTSNQERRQKRRGYYGRIQGCNDRGNNEHFKNNYQPNNNYQNNNGYFHYNNGYQNLYHRQNNNWQHRQQQYNGTSYLFPNSNT